MNRVFQILIWGITLNSLTFSQPNPVWHNFVPLNGREIAVDPYRDQLLWIAGTGGLFRYNTMTNTWETYTTAHGLSKIWARSLFIERDVIWVGTDAGGANRFNLNTGRFTPFLQFPLDPNYPEFHPTVHVIYPQEDTIWLGTDIGLFQVDRASLDTLKRFTMEDGLGENYVYSIKEDENYLWLATAFGGVFIPELPPPTGGLSRLDKNTLQITNFRIAEGPYVNWFWSMAEHGDTLWIASPQGLVIFDKNTGQFDYVLKDTITIPTQVIAGQNDIWCVGESHDLQIHLSV